MKPSKLTIDHLSHRTAKEIHTQIGALKFTLKEYDAQKHDCDHCKLCSVAKDLKRHHYGREKAIIYYDINRETWSSDFYCLFCPWIWFTNETCSEYYDRNYITIYQLDQSNEYYRLKGQHQIKIRQKQIRMWIKKMEAYLNGISERTSSQKEK